MLVPVIIAGGTGTRLWPLSREAMPKQFLALIDDTPSTMLEQTVARLGNLCAHHLLIMVCNEAHRFIASEQLRHAGITTPHLILEPEGRNTAPAIALAAMDALAFDRDAMLLVMPADHYLRDISAFQETVRLAMPTAENGSLVAFGVPPSRPEPGYGYIRVEPGAGKVLPILEFVEKPDTERAAKYLADGGYLWNSGMTLTRADAYLRELRTHARDIFESCRMAYVSAERDADFIRPERRTFLACRADSIDYAVMEHTRDAKAVLLDAGWSDLGTWDTLRQVSTKNPQGNTLIGDVISMGCKNSYIRSESRLVATLGLTNQIVVETPDAILVASQSESLALKKLVEQLRITGQMERKQRQRTFHPWGWIETLIENPHFVVKRFRVRPSEDLLAHFDHCHAKHWIVISGIADIQLHHEHFQLVSDQSIYIPLGERHQLNNPGDYSLEVIEIQIGGNESEDGIIHFENKSEQVEHETHSLVTLE